MAAYFGIGLLFLAIGGLGVAVAYAIVLAWPEFIRLVRDFWDPRVFFASLTLFGTILLMIGGILAMANCGGVEPGGSQGARDGVDDPAGQCEPIGHECTLVTTCCGDVWCNFGDGGDANFHGTCMAFPHQ